VTPRPRLFRRRRPPRPTISPPKTVAITGGIGAGKSEALRAFARHGAATASADELVHRLYADPEVKRLVVERWGDRVLGADGEVDRKAIGAIVFADAEELAWLEAVLHPRTVEAQRLWLEELPEDTKLAVVEVPLLYETGAETRFDGVVVITAPADVRAGRARVADVRARERRLLPDEGKVARADFTYVNDASLEDLDAFVADVVARLA